MSDDQDIVRLFLTAPWVTLAACRGLSRDRFDLFFPDKHDSTAAANGRAVCKTCTVREECLTYSLDEGIRDGIWGGMSERERRPVRKARSLAMVDAFKANLEPVRVLPTRSAGWDVFELEDELAAVHARMDAYAYAYPNGAA